MKIVDDITNCFFSEKSNIAFQASYNDSLKIKHFEPGNAIFVPINMQGKINSIAILKIMQVRQVMFIISIVKTC